jgi:CheY-like chemotaxis protein
MRILVIDDDPVSRQIVSSGLKKAGYKLGAVDSAQAALKELESGETAALVITDVMLPDMTGLDFLALLRSTPEYSELPVIVCTASEASSFRQLAEAFEACAFFPKPLQMKDLKRVVKEILTQERPCISDLRKTCERMDMSVDEAIEMLDEVQRQIETCLGNVEEMLGRGEVRAVRDTCGALRGAAESVGADRVGLVLKKIDETSGEIHPDVLRAILPELRREGAVLRESVDALKILPKDDASVLEIRIAALCVDDGSSGDYAPDPAPAEAADTSLASSEAGAADASAAGDPGAENSAVAEGSTSQPETIPANG